MKHGSTHSTSTVLWGMAFLFSGIVVAVAYGQPGHVIARVRDELTPITSGPSVVHDCFAASIGF